MNISVFQLFGGSHLFRQGAVGHLSSSPPSVDDDEKDA